MNKNEPNSMQSQKPISYVFHWKSADHSVVEGEDARKRVGELKRQVRVKLLRRTVNLDFFV